MAEAEERKDATRSGHAAPAFLAPNHHHRTYRNMQASTDASNLFRTESALAEEEVCPLYFGTLTGAKCSKKMKQRLARINSNELKSWVHP
jgi:hypothetical protein